MTKTNSSETNKRSTNINIVDGKLILSLPNAQMPVVWQTDLDSAKSAAFTIKEDKKEKSFVLILKTQGGNIDEIAHFGDKQASVDVLMEVSNVLQNAHGQIKPESKTANSNNIQSSVSKDKSNKGNKLGAAIAATLIVILIIIWVIAASGNIRTKETQSSYNNSASSTSSSGTGSAGVPVSVEDYLNNR